MNTSAAVSSAAKKKTKISSVWKHKTNYLFVLPGVLFMACFLVFPIVYNLVLSFKNMTLMNMKGEQQFVGWSNYAKLFRDEVFQSSFMHSVTFTAVCIAAQFCIGFALALFFNKRFPGRDAMRSVMLLAWMMPVVITASLFKWMLSGDHGIVNYLLQWLGIMDKPKFWLEDSSTSLLGASFANIWVGIPFNMVILLSGLQALPEHLYEAAKIDGAGRLRQFKSITLPLLKPTILVLLMLGIIYTFKVFDLIFIMTGGGPVNSSTVLPLYGYRLAFTNYDFSMGSTVASTMFVLLVILAAVYLWMTRGEEKH